MSFFVAAPRGTQPNILVILMDDVGKEMLGCYGQPTAVDTPNIDTFAQSAIRFSGMHVQPICSPTRALLLTGRYAYRTGIGAVTKAPWQNGHELQGPGLPSSEYTIANALGDAGYATAARGKWHLADHVQNRWHPLNYFDSQKGSGWNLHRDADYDRWLKWDEADKYVTEVYATDDTTSDAVAYINAAEDPWFLYLCYNAAHGPYHEPPGCTASTTKEMFECMVESLDAAIGTVLAEVDLATTYVFILGDNGTPGEVGVLPPGAHFKGDLYEGGVCVPMLVAGPGISAGTNGDLISGADLFATLAELAGSAATADDSQSFAALLTGGTYTPREYIFCERFAPNGLTGHDFHDRMVFDGRFKLIERSEITDEFYDLLNDPTEDDPLALEGNDYERLASELTEYR